MYALRNVNPFSVGFGSSLINEMHADGYATAIA